MNTYDIGDLERISGIKAHTIRIWEKRYNLIKPGRKKTNIRIYTDNQIRKLLNVKTLLEKGWKISRIASLSDKALIEQVYKLSQQANTDEKNHPSLPLLDYYINELLYFGLIYDEINFNNIYLNAISNYGFTDTMLHIIYPLLRKIGLLWETQKAIPAQEHFMSHLIRKKIISATDALPFISKPYSSPFLLFLPENEYHEIPLLFSNYILRSSHVKTLYLGPNVPLENVILAGEKNNVVNYLSVLTSNHSTRELVKLKTEIQKNFKHLKKYTLFLGGNPEAKKVFSSMKNLVWMDDAEFLLKKQYKPFS